MSRLFLIVIVFFGTCTLINAQNNIPELEKQLKTAKEKDKFETLYKLSKAYLAVSPKKSLKYGNQAFDIAEQLKNKNMQANALNMIGTAYYKQGKYKSAIKYYEKELGIREKLGHRVSKAKILYNIGSVYEANNKEKKALTEYKKALKTAKSIKYPYLAYKCYESIIQINASQSDYKEAFLNLQEYNSYRGATNITFERRKIDILETKFEEGKKVLEEKESQLNLVDSTLTLVKSEKETLVKDTASKGQAISGLTLQTKKQKLTIEEQKLEVKRQRQWLITFAAFFTVIFIFSILLYKLYTAKKKANHLLAIQNAEIIEKNEEISVQSEELMIRNSEIQEQKEEIEAQAEELVIQRDIALKSKEEIIDSINYAKRIQKAIFPSEKYANEILPEYFILLKPRDIVSGDFYWIKKIKNFTVIAVADCTGHGVPGAFMSMLGTSFLNDIVSPRSLDNAGEILERLRNKVKKSLGQKGKDSESKDGMDIALYIINTETLELQYSGAYNPLYMIREKPEAELETIKADRQPIGVHPIEKEFTNHKIQLQKGDCLYTFSDGYADQFGGKHGQKFKSKNFKEILLANYQKPMSEQKQVLNNKIKDWMGQDYEQIDDIIVLGVRI